MAADIAVVSFERFLNGDDKARREVAREIYDAFSSVGWVYIKDHGVDSEDAFKLVRLNAFATFSMHRANNLVGEAVL